MWYYVYNVDIFCTVPPSTHGELESQGLSADGIPYVIGSDGFMVQEVAKVIPYIVPIVIYVFCGLS